MYKNLDNTFKPNSISSESGFFYISKSSTFCIYVSVLKRRNNFLASDKLTIYLFKNILFQK